MKLVNPNRNNSDDDVYHTKPSCPYVTSAYRNIDSAPVPTREFRECNWCADTVDRKGTNMHGCPFCGTDVNKLPDHLPCEESP